MQFSTFYRSLFENAKRKFGTLKRPIYKRSIKLHEVNSKINFYYRFASSFSPKFIFTFQKMLLVVRHDKETEQITRHNERLAKAQEDRQRSDRSRLPKWQRNDAKTRESMYKGQDKIQAHSRQVMLNSEPFTCLSSYPSVYRLQFCVPLDLS